MLIRLLNWKQFIIHYPDSLQILFILGFWCSRCGLIVLDSLLIFFVLGFKCSSCGLYVRTYFVSIDRNSDLLYFPDILFCLNRQESGFIYFGEILFCLDRQDSVFIYFRDILFCLYKQESGYICFPDINFIFSYISFYMHISNLFNYFSSSTFYLLDCVKL